MSATALSTRRKSTLRDPFRFLEQVQGFLWKHTAPPPLARRAGKSAHQSQSRRMPAGLCGWQLYHGKGTLLGLPPNDYDACWAIDGVEPALLDPVFFDFSNSRAQQKGKFGGEFFPADLPEGVSGKTFLEFFQIDRETGGRKGIVAIEMETLT